MIAEAVTHIVFVAAALVYTAGRTERRDRSLRHVRASDRSLGPVRELARRIGLF
jgi:hypothetical protein